MNTIHYFNPGHEYSVLNPEPSYTLPVSAKVMMSNLSALPLWYASKDDLVLVDDSFDRSYYNWLLSLGLHLPGIVTKKELKRYNKFYIQPWGISPTAVRFVEKMNKEYHIDLVPPIWDDSFIYLTSRMMSRDILSEIKADSSYYDFISLPMFFSEMGTVEAYSNQYSGKLLAKAPFSSSGRGLLWIPETGISRVERQIIQGILNKQKTVSIENVYNKVLDFAMEFISDGCGNLSFQGYSLFSTNEKGAYSANHLLNQDIIEEKIAEYVSMDRLSIAKYKLLEILSKHYVSIYKGCIGVDMMVVELDGDYKLHPCVEVNMRYNMGYLSVKLFDNFINQSEGTFNVDFGKEGTLLQNHKQMLEQYPLRIEMGQIKSGYLSLCPVVAETQYRAYILIK